LGALQQSLAEARIEAPELLAAIAEARAAFERIANLYDD
jgi:hypothetical protein